MGFLGYLLPPNIIFDNDTINDPTFINKICYFFIDELNINYITARNPEEVNIDIKLKYEGDITWDSTKPTGPRRRLVDIKKAKKLIGYKVPTTLEKGLEETINWYQEKHN